MCREQLPVWQEFYSRNKNRNFEIVAIAMDAAAPEQAAAFYEQSGVTFVRGIDGADALWETLGFSVVPNGIFVDESRIVRYAKFGGFEARVDQDREAIERLLAAPAAAPVEIHQGSPVPMASGAGEWFRKGVDALKRGDKQAAAQHWKRALALDPKN